MLEPMPWKMEARKFIALSSEKSKPTRKTFLHQTSAPCARASGESSQGVDAKAQYCVPLAFTVGGAPQVFPLGHFDACPENQSAIATNTAMAAAIQTHLGIFISS